MVPKIITRKDKCSPRANAVPFDSYALVCAGHAIDCFYAACVFLKFITERMFATINVHCYKNFVFFFTS